MQKFNLDTPIALTVPHYDGKDPFNRKGQTGKLIRLLETKKGLTFILMFDTEDDKFGSIYAEYQADIWLN